MAINHADFTTLGAFLLCPIVTGGAAADAHAGQPLSGYNAGMKLRFSIRDLLWLVLVVALAAGWWFDHKHAEEVNANQGTQLESDKSQLSEMRKELGIISHSITKQATP
jgi:hypothetical protein